MTTTPSPRGASQSVVTYRVGGREYPMRTVSQCSVCISPYRFEVEEALVGGRTYTKIAQSLDEEAGLTKDSIRRHYVNDHMPAEQSGTRAIIEARATEVGKRIMDSDKELVDGITLANVVIQKAFEEIASGRQTPDVREGIAAVKMLADLGAYDSGGTVGQEDFIEGYIVFQENAQRIMSPEQYAQFAEALDANPVLAALAARFDGSEPETIEGSVEQEADGG